MRHPGIVLAATALAFTLAAGTADAASQKSRRAANPQDSMADQLNAQSLSRAQAGTDSPTQAVDSTSNLNRMSERDAARGKAMPQPPMPFR